MRKFIRLLSAIVLCVYCNLVWANGISGAPLADFLSNELTVPCVLVKNSDDEALNDKYFDVILERRDNSFNYELVFAVPEDQAHCQRVGDFASFDDDDITGEGTAKILVSCEKRTNRSKISVDGKNLPSGDYSSRVISGNVSVVSSIKTTFSDEVEFDFDSSTNDIAEGATEISADFIQNGSVNAEIFDDNGNTIASITNALCAIRN